MQKAVFLFCAATVVLPAQTLTTLASLTTSSGVAPVWGVVQGTDGSFYGTAYWGGTYYSGNLSTGAGTIFKVTPAGALTALHDFVGTDGQLPAGGLIQGTDGNFYGTTSAGGANGGGTIFKITPGGTLTTLHNFCAQTNCSDGKDPTGTLIQATDGNLYGITVNGGNNDNGTIFKITPAGALTTLHSFVVSDGSQPWAALIQATDGNLYGTTGYGGANGDGTIFKITLAGVLTTFYNFTAADGWPGDGTGATLMQASDGNFYGTTTEGGPNHDGTIFKATPAGALTTLYSFAGTDGSVPFTLLQATDGNFYGETRFAGANNYGTLFRMTPGGTLTTLHTFAGSDGNDPAGGLMQASDGNLYGTTQKGGATGNGGTVFRLALPPAMTLTTLASFNSSNGATPGWVGLVQASDGNFYGTTHGGGDSGYGTIFKTTPAGTLTTLHSFVGTDGSQPWAGLIQASDGNFYGTTSRGGSADDDGTVFKVTPAGVLTDLHVFSGTDGLVPESSLVQATDGNFYGTTGGGGTPGNGTVFKLTPAGTVTTLYNFALTDGNVPYAGLIQASDGNFYGTTGSGGPNGWGTVFKITPAGALTTLYGFGGPDGKYVYGGVIQAKDGNFYGTTVQGGANGFGTVFKLTPAGALTTLHNFTSTDGAQPYAALVQASDGNFYGTTNQGGTNDFGTIFEITPAGKLTTLHNFTGTDGGYPMGALIQATDGNFYGTTSENGGGNSGTVFRFAPAPAQPAIIEGGVVSGASFQAGIVPNSWITIYGTGLSPTNDTWAKAVVNGSLPQSLDNVSISVGGQPAYVEYISPGQINALAPDVGPGNVSVTVTNANGTSWPVTATAQMVQPAFFPWGSYAVATRADYSLAVKNGTFAGVTTVPAKPGDTIILWGTGFGPTTPAAPDGVAVPTDTIYYTANTVTVTVGDTAATVAYAALTPGSAGLYQVAIQIPTALADGDYPVVATVSGVPSPSTVLITVQK